MSGTIGITANENGRYTVFTASLAGLARPEGVALRWGMGSDTIANRNEIVRAALEGEWLWFMDDDHAFAPDILLRLLAHEREDAVIVPLCLKRQQPFIPCAFSARGGDDLYPIDLARLPSGGLVPVYAAGTAGMLIPCGLLEEIPEPWFEHDPIGEDVLFCEKVRETGAQILCDLETPLGHLTTAAVWPSFADGRWNVGFNVADGFSLICPLAEPQVNGRPSLVLPHGY